MSTKIQQNKLLSLLVKNNLLNEEQSTKVRKIASLDKKTVENVLLEKNLVDVETLVKFKAEALNLPYQSLLEKKINDQALNVIPIEVAENYKIICFNKDDKKLK